MFSKKKRNPYKLSESEMTPEEYDIVFPPDDGIDFQWGPTYIKSRDVSEKGGKYWRSNEDGSITEFDPPAFRIRVAVKSILRKEKYDFNILKQGEEAVLEFRTPELAASAVKHFENVFWTTRSIAARAEGNLLIIECILKVVFESTYFPATGK